MVFDRLKDAAQQAKTAATDLGNVALEKITQYQKELNEAIPVFRATGLSVTNFGMDMAVPPVVRLTLVGAVAAIQPDKLQGVIDTHKDKKIVVMVLEALRTAGLVKDQLGDLGLHGVTAEVVLALSPSVKVDYMKDVPRA
jgi:hypothetical protein